jgi:hypothetical protein
LPQIRWLVLMRLLCWVLRRIDKYDRPQANGWVGSTAQFERLDQSCRSACLNVHG